MGRAGHVWMWASSQEPSRLTSCLCFLLTPFPALALGSNPLLPFLLIPSPVSCYRATVASVFGPCPACHCCHLGLVFLKVHYGLVTFQGHGYLPNAPQCSQESVPEHLRGEGVLGIPAVASSFAELTHKDILPFSFGWMFLLCLINWPSPAYAHTAVSQSTGRTRDQHPVLLAV